MAINRTPVLKRCRSLDMEPAYLGVNKTSYRKSMRSGRKVSEYGLQLREKQKAKFIYGVQEKPFRNLYEKAERMPGLVGTNLMQLLELRLDNIIFRMGFAGTSICSLNGSSITFPDNVSKLASSQAGTETPLLASTISLNLWIFFDFSLISIVSPG